MIKLSADRSRPRYPGQVTSPAIQAWRGSLNRFRSIGCLARRRCCTNNRSRHAAGKTLRTCRLHRYAVVLSNLRTLKNPTSGGRPCEIRRPKTFHPTTMNKTGWCHQNAQYVSRDQTLFTSWAQPAHFISRRRHDVPAKTTTFGNQRAEEVAERLLRKSRRQQPHLLHLS